ncbi:MAG TPA: hypothetical protein VGQ30_07025, partial [Gemmatimonadaceae bacterium]|nr:hypothetical protein [Gemmatimonadaceae bacterium]
MLAEPLANIFPSPTARGGRQCVLITDGDERAALAASRSLIAAGHRVVVTGAASRTLAGVSRGAIPVAIRADPLREPSAYVYEVMRRADHLDVTVLLPISDPSVEAFLEHRSELPPGILLPFPSLASYRAASDKIGMMDCARRAGLDAPESILIDSPAELGPFSAELFPAIMKPHRSVVTGPDGRRIKCAVEFVADESELQSALAKLPSGAFPVLVQRRIRGPGEGMFALRWNGKIIATFGHRRLREKPPAGGISVFRESIAIDPGLEAAG